MKKLLLSLLLAIACFATYAQNTFPSSGNVGIGTTSPSSQLAIGGSNVNNPNTTGVDIPYTALTFQNQNSGANYNIARITAIQENGDYLDAGALSFSTGVAGLYERMRISTGGYVGIGTTNPTNLLHIYGSGGNTLLNIQSTSASGYSQMAYTGTGSTFNTGIGNASETSWGVPNSWYIFDATNNAMRFVIKPSGNVLIGKTTQINSSYILDVNGSVRANAITINVGGADFVFEPTYKLLTLPELNNFIQKNHHLPEIASAKDMQANGLNVGDNQIKLLQKVEELTLYLIEKDKQVKSQQQQIDNQQQQLDELKKQLNALLKLKNK